MYPLQGFENPSKDFSRAMRFYNTILEEPLKDMSDQMQCPYAFFPMECQGIEWVKASAERSGEL